MTQMNKQLLVIHTGDDPQFGGIQRMCYDGIQAFKQAGIFGEALGPQPGSVRWALSYLQKARLCRGGTFILHAGLAKLFWLRRPHDPIFVFLHGIEVWRPFPWYHTRILQGTTKFITNTQFTWDQFKRWHPKLASIPHEVTHLGLNEPIAFEEPDPTVPAAMIISRLDRGEDYKGHREIIAVWDKVREAIPGAELWVAGDGNLKEDLEKIVPPGSGIVFLGHIDANEKERRLKRCRCLAMPSRGEGFGLVYIEAMRLGRPCLVSDEDAGREVVNPPESGLEVNQKDLPALTKALIFLLGNSRERSEMAFRAKKRYDENFTLTHYQKRLLKAVTL